MHLKLSKIIGINSGREWLILLFCLLFAFFMWAVQNFSRKGMVYMDMQVEFITNVDGHAQKSASPVPVWVYAESSGFYVLQQKLMPGSNVLSLNVDSKYVRQYRNDASEDVFYVLGDDASSLIQSGVKERFSVEKVMTDTLFFTLPVEGHKKVPVVFNGEVQYDSQYMSFDEIRLNPDSVVVYGEPLILNNIDSVMTEMTLLKSVRENINGVARIQNPNNMRMSADKAYYSQSVGRYVETSVSLPIQTINVPSGKTLTLIPNQVDVVFRHPLSLRKKFMPSDFVLVVDYEDFIKNPTSKVRPIVAVSPDGIFNVSLLPEIVECIER